MFLFFSPPKPLLFLFWLLPSSPLPFLYFLTLSGLVSCVTGNVTVSSFFFPFYPPCYYCCFIFLALFITLFFSFNYFPLLISFTPLFIYCQNLFSCLSHDQSDIAPPLSCDTFNQIKHWAIICVHTATGENIAHCLRCSQKVTLIGVVLFSLGWKLPKKRETSEKVDANLCCLFIVIELHLKWFRVGWSEVFCLSPL